MPKLKVNFRRSIFNQLYYPFRNLTTRIQIFFGGSSSGKSKFLAQRDIYDLLKGGRNFLILRNVADTLRSSVYNEMRQVIDQYNLDRFFVCTVSPMQITCVNGYCAIFKGMDEIEKVKSIIPPKGVITDVRIEEATEVKDENSIKQLKKRLRGIAKYKDKKTGKVIEIKKRLTMSFNPIYKTHWIYKTYFKGKWTDEDTQYHDDELFILHSTYKDNRFLAPDDIKELEDETDQYFYDVYTLGKWGILGDRIFNNFFSADLSDKIPYFNYIRNGLDFGFSNHPTAYNRTHYDSKKRILYIFKEFQGLGLTNYMIAERLKPIIGYGHRGEIVVCDSAEPKSIEELIQYGINAIGAMKGKDSVNFGIQWLQGLTAIIIDKSCQNTLNEFELYHWKKNKQGEVLNIPVDKDNHHIDNIRYQYEDEALNLQEPEVYVVGTYN